MHAYISRKTRKKDDMEKHFAKVKCPSCWEAEHVQLPSEFWLYLLRNDACLSDEQRKLLYRWQPVIDTPDQMIYWLKRLDQVDNIDVSKMVNAVSSNKFVGFGSADENHWYRPQEDIVMEEVDPTGSGGYTEFGKFDEENLLCFYDCEDLDDMEFDQSIYDADGEPLVDNDGQCLIPFDENGEYEEDEANKLRIRAATYRQRTQEMGTNGGKGRQRGST